MTASRYALEVRSVKKGEPPRALPLSEGENVVGRSATCTHCINDASLSRQHVRLIVEWESVLVEDLGSLNGTQLNGHKIEGRMPLRPGDVLELGEVEARLVANVADADAGGGAWFQLLNTPLKGKTFYITGRTALMGRGQACDLRIEHATMSRVHSRLTWRADAAGWVIEDAGSANGTFVDSTPVTQAMLKPGQTVKLGEVELLFLDSPPPAPRRTRLIVALLLGLLALAVAAVALNIYLSAAG